MVRLTSPNGVEVRVGEAQAAKLLALGYAEAGGETKKKAEPRKRQARPKE